MEDVKIYIVIENKKTGQETNISGSLDLLRTFMKEIANIDLLQVNASQRASVLNPPILEPQP